VSQIEIVYGGQRVGLSWLILSRVRLHNHRAGLVATLFASHVGLAGPL
jgi:hypothetical protein